MYPEEFEGFQEADKGPRAYVSNVAAGDADRLARENEKLRKSLEKEKFFNKLLDQELKEVKAEAAARYPADFETKKGVSKGAFYTLLIITLALAAYLVYLLYFSNQNAALSNAPESAALSPIGTDNNDAAADDPASFDNSASGNTGEATGGANATSPGVTTGPATPSAAARDTVPEIIGSTAAAAKKPAQTEPRAATPPAPSADEEYNEAEVEAEIADIPPASSSQPADTEPAAPAAAAPTRPVIAKYLVTSKANFYSSADENTLRSAFIPGGNKSVDALEDQNGFIYVEYTNERGMVTKGWLSKKDLTKAE